MQDDSRPVFVTGFFSLFIGAERIFLNAGNLSASFHSASF
ncbi:hypothetical protein NBRC3257_0470 [Gluconobacter thailandicus NBRC 3257]|uniref:Uncharacterized protein n=1 Tax=Gluconobacter thailandicus NBRC 3257 TaxID=1381097 RepID=A0ABQ0ITG0_GLUTH|nr:hypothetical protein B932_2029 [Gluconobacter oxydans H24]GAC87569.1 hypothetical protein NBRC3255_1230 [Gluconobacter thailandicus NBRC 3255]GAD25471.1 hypothetical protein NBRC3257_0470 [Gluconobacter thailandicus NBRC 3257]